VYIANHARHLATFSALGRWRKFTMNVSSIYKARDAQATQAIGAVLDPDYLLWNGQVGCKISGFLTLSVQVQNIFDTDYQNILGAPMPGRWFIGKVALRF